MTPQEVALHLTENYLSTVDLNLYKDKEYSGKTTKEIYKDIYDYFFEMAASDINENNRKLSSFN